MGELSRGWFRNSVRHPRGRNKAVRARCVVPWQAKLRDPTAQRRPFTYGPLINPFLRRMITQSRLWGSSAGAGFGILLATEGVGIKPARRPGSSWQISEQSSRSRRRSARRFGILFAKVGVGIKPALCRGAPPGPGRPGRADGPAGPGPEVPDPLPPFIPSLPRPSQSGGVNNQNPRLALTRGWFLEGGPLLKKIPP